MTVDLKVDTRYTERDEESPTTPGRKVIPQQTHFKTFVTIFASVGLLLAVVHLNKSRSQSQNNETSSITDARSLAGTGASNSYLYFLSDDPTEFYNKFSTTGYTDTAAAIYKNATALRSVYQAPTIPDSTNQIIAYTAAGGISPWITSSNTARTITQKYSYSGAPHIVFFLVDDWGYNDAGYQSSYLNWTTPNIDKLMRSGIRLTNYFTHELCTPSRAALMTGRYASRFGMHGDSTDELNLPLTEVTLAEEMHSAGYRSYLIGKWHLGRSEWAYTPTYRGFDYFYGYYGGFVDYWDKTDGTYLDLHEGTSLVTNTEELSTSMHSAYIYQKKAEAVIASHATNYPSTPMFMYYASQLIHDTWEAPQHFIDRCSGGTTDQQTYCGMNLMLDEVVGNLTCALKSNGMFENTLFVLVSDNGGANTMTGSSAPWRGGKGSLWRGGTSVPGFIYGTTGLIPASQQGTEYAGIVHVTDWLPTLMGVATNKAWTGGYTGNTMDGVDNFNSIVTNSASKRHEILHFLNAAGNTSYQYDMVKGIINTIKTAPFKTPDHYFIGNTSGTTDHCTFMSTMSAVPHSSPTYVPSIAGPTLSPTTAAPTKRPKPTVSPTSASPTFTTTTQTPSTLPTPSSMPSLGPTKTNLSPLPTASPTAVPTTLPTAIPTIGTTPVPTAPPTKFPTTTPTIGVTASPSLKPSTGPTYPPSFLPSIGPSAAATQVSTAIPTAVPTVVPTPVATTVPSTVAPSAQATDVPTNYPVLVHTRVPTTQPVNTDPTPVPTQIPTRKPSVKPKPTVTAMAL